MGTGDKTHYRPTHIRIYGRFVLYGQHNNISPGLRCAFLLSLLLGIGLVTFAQRSNQHYRHSLNNVLYTTCREREAYLSARLNCFRHVPYNPIRDTKFLKNYFYFFALRDLTGYKSYFFTRVCECGFRRA